MGQGGDEPRGAQSGQLAVGGVQLAVEDAHRGGDRLSWAKSTCPCS